MIKGEKAKDTHFSSKKECIDEATAIQEFNLAKERLFDVNAWSKIPAIANSTFSLYDDNGFPLVEKKPKVGNFIKIVLPGPLPENWVRIIELKEEENNAEFTVQPSYDPTKGGNTNTVEHFFDEGARSMFRVVREGTLIEAAEIGRNEGINNAGEEAGNRKVLNTLVAEGGWAGFQKYQWENLTDYIIDEIR